MEHKLATSWVREVIVRIVRDMEMPCNIGASAEPHLNPVAAFYLVGGLRRPDRFPVVARCRRTANVGYLMIEISSRSQGALVSQRARTTYLL